MHLANGVERPDYGWTQAITMSITLTLLIIWAACGSERRGSHFELAKAAGDAGEFGDKRERPSEEGAVVEASEVKEDVEEKDVSAAGKK